MLTVLVDVGGERFGVVGVEAVSDADGQLPQSLGVAAPEAGGGVDRRPRMPAASKGVAIGARPLA